MMQHDSIITPNILATEISTGTVVAGTSLTTTCLLFFENSLSRMIPYFFIALIVIALDLGYGIKAARIREEEVTVSRAARRTFGKMFEYFGWAVLGSTLAVASGHDGIQTGIMLAVIGIELISVFRNLLFVKKRKKLTVDVPKVAEAVISAKIGADVHGAIKIEDAGPENKEEKG